MSEIYVPGTIGLKYIQDMRGRILGAKDAFVEKRDDETAVNKEVKERLNQIKIELEVDRYTPEKITKMLQVYEKIFYASYYFIDPDYKDDIRLRGIRDFALLGFTQYLSQMPDMIDILQKERSDKKNGESKADFKEILNGGASWNEKEMDIHSITDFSTPGSENQCLIYTQNNNHFIGIEIVKTLQGNTKFIISDSFSRGKNSGYMNGILKVIYQNAKIPLNEIEIELRNVRDNGNNDCVVHSVFNNIFSSKYDKILYQGSFEEASKKFSFIKPNIKLEDALKFKPISSGTQLSEKDKNKLLQLFNESKKITFKTKPPISFSFGIGTDNEYVHINSIEDLKSREFFGTKDGKDSTYQILFDEKGNLIGLKDTGIVSAIHKFVVSEIQQEPKTNFQPLTPISQISNKIKPQKGLTNEDKHRKDFLLKIFNENKFVKINTLDNQGKRVVLEFENHNARQGGELNCQLADTTGNPYFLDYSGDKCVLFKADGSELSFDLSDVVAAPKPQQEFMQTSISSLPIATQKDIIEKSPYIDKIQNLKSRKIEKRIISSNKTSLGLEFAELPAVKVDISFKTQNGDVLTLKQAFQTLLEEKQTLQSAKQEMENILSITLNSMDKGKRQKLADGFKVYTNREIAKKITNQVLKELNMPDVDRKPERYSTF
ncbi:MAG: hypothetical protein Ta2D_12440 [Rickettsiales bacterium]|nr:MAG: hypothetical protein Ta2D_12440 [Rickettsiales bacterium]